jgi:hypothetical protein
MRREFLEVPKGFLFASILMEQRAQKQNRLIVGLAVVTVGVGLIQVLLAIISICLSYK